MLEPETHSFLNLFFTLLLTLGFELQLETYLQRKNKKIYTKVLG